MSVFTEVITHLMDEKTKKVAAINNTYRELRKAARQYESVKLAVLYLLHFSYMLMIGCLP